MRWKSVGQPTRFFPLIIPCSACLTSSWVDFSTQCFSHFSFYLWTNLSSPFKELQIRNFLMNFESNFPQNANRRVRRPYFDQMRDNFFAHEFPFPHFRWFSQGAKFAIRLFEKCFLDVFWIFKNIFFMFECFLVWIMSLEVLFFLTCLLVICQIGITFYGWPFQVVKLDWKSVPRGVITQTQWSFGTLGYRLMFLYGFSEKDSSKLWLSILEIQLGLFPHFYLD